MKILKLPIFFIFIHILLFGCKTVDNQNKIKQKFDKLIPYRVGVKWGYSDKKKNIVIKPAYDFVSQFNTSVAVVSIKEKWGLIDSTGKIIFPIICDRIYFNLLKPNQLFRIKIDGKLGIINNQGKVIIDTIYDYVAIPQFNIILAKNYKQHASYIYNLEGEKLFTIKNDRVDYFSKDNILSIKGKEYSLISLKQEYKSLGKLEQVLEINEGLIAYEKNGKFGYMDGNGEIIISPKYDFASPFVNGFATVGQNKKSFIINKKGKIINKMGYEGIGKLNNGLIPVKLNGKWGYIDLLDNIKIDFQFDDASNFSLDLAVVKKNNKRGVINTRGELIIDYKYKQILDYYDGITSALTDNGWVVLDKKGNQILPDAYNTEFLKFRSCIDKIYGINGKYIEGDGGFIDINGNKYFKE